ncbi:MAG: hypothetical protein ACUVR4_14160 [Anaerolineae bacterium]
MSGFISCLLPINSAPNLEVIAALGLAVAGFLIVAMLERWANRQASRLAGSTADGLTRHDHQVG